MVLKGCPACAGVNFMEKTVAIRNAEITFSIWDLCGQQEFVNMLPLVFPLSAAPPRRPHPSLSPCPYCSDLEPRDFGLGLAGMPSPTAHLRF